MAPMKRIGRCRRSGSPRAREKTVTSPTTTAVLGVLDVACSTSWLEAMRAEGPDGALPDVEGMSVKELRRHIRHAGLSSDGIVEKAELRARCREALGLVR